MYPGRKMYTRGNPAASSAFSAAPLSRADAMTDACTRCGKCVEVCPSTGPAGVTADPVAVIGGVIDIMRGGEGNESARNWASGCLLHGDCIKACDYGVNPRFLLYMTRIAMAHANERIPDSARTPCERLLHIGLAVLKSDLAAEHPGSVYRVAGRLPAALGRPMIGWTGW